MSINSIKPWMQQNQGTITALAVGAPLAIETGLLIKNIINNPRFPLVKLEEFKNRLIEAFTPQKDETLQQTILKISKNVFLLIAFLALSSAAFYGAICFLPLGAAIPLALTTIFYLGKAIVQAPAFFKQFSIQPGEELSEGKKRIAKLVLKTSIIGLLALAGISLGCYVVYPIITEGFKWTISLPFQTKPIVFLEYAFVGLIHLGLAIHNYIKGDKQNSLFHLFTAALSIIFPLYYWNNQMRIHHSFLGLILMALPFRTMKWIGSAITLDSSMYMFMANRHDFDFMNILWGKLPLFVGTESAAILAEGINDEWGQESKQSPCQRLNHNSHQQQQTASS
ncbi:MAG: hypothetical protein JSS30_03510 [Verrucomicrobia bacterium]|nr:hypothetical protein [Verrucomicrobiota bacterium]